jgi:hypothetical protein
MFLSIYHNQSGEEFLRRLGPNEQSNDLRAHVRKWAEKDLDGYPFKLSFSEPGSHIPNGCGEYQAEIRHTKAPSGSCRSSEPFYLELEEF